MPANLENAAVATGLEKVSFHSNSNDRQWQECSNYCTIALISHASVLAWRIPGMGSHRVRHDWSDLAAAAAAAAHASKVMCKILQARLQQYMNSELPDFKLVLEKAEETEIKLPTSAGSSPFELWWWRRLLGVPWTSSRSNQSILKEISPEYSLEGLMLKLNSNTFATWCEKQTHWKRPWCWERLKVGGEGDDRGWDVWMASSTQWTWV